MEAGTLLRSLAIALVVVSPFFLWKLSQVRRHRAERAERAAAALDDAPATEVRPRLEDVVERIDALAADLAAGGDEPPTVLVPAGVTVDGREPPDGVVDLLVRDALRRSGLVATAELDTADGRVIECARITELRP